MAMSGRLQLSWHLSFVAPWPFATGLPHLLLYPPPHPEMLSCGVTMSCSPKNHTLLFQTPPHSCIFLFSKGRTIIPLTSCLLLLHMHASADHKVA